MGGSEFYTEASKTTQALRATLFLKERDMLGPYNTSVFSLLLLLCPIEAHYYYYCYGGSDYIATP